MIGTIRIESHQGDLRACLRVRGRVLGGAGAERLLERIHRALASGARVLVLDLSGVEAIDGGGVGLILACWQAARRRGVRFLVRRAQGSARRILEMSALLRPLEQGLPGPAAGRGHDAVLLLSA